MKRKVLHMPKTKVCEPEFKKKNGVRWLLRQMGICPNAYYNHKKNRKAGYRQKKEKFKNKILQIYHEYSGNPGYRMRRVYLLRAKISLSNTSVLKYMQELGIQSTVTPKKPTYKKGDCYKKFENHLNAQWSGFTVYWKASYFQKLSPMAHCPFSALGYDPLKCECGTTMLFLELYFNHKHVSLEMVCAACLVYPQELQSISRLNP